MSTTTRENLVNAAAPWAFRKGLHHNGISRVVIATPPGLNAEIRPHVEHHLERNPADQVTREGRQCASNRGTRPRGTPGMRILTMCP